VLKGQSLTEGLVALWRWLARPFSRRDLLEAALVGAGFFLYFAVRGAVIDRPETAYANALDIIDVQRKLGFFWELDMQEWIKDRLFLVQSANYVYFWLHFPLIIAFGIWLYFRDRRKYTVMRDLMLASGGLALIVYWLYPVAPPRELPNLALRFDPDAPSYVTAFIDTMKVHLGYAYQSQSTAAFVNPYAATMQVASITVTANHFLLDAIAGGGVCLAAIPVAWGLQRWGYPFLGRALARLPWPFVAKLLALKRQKEAAELGSERPRV